MTAPTEPIQLTQIRAMAKINKLRMQSSPTLTWLASKKWNFWIVWLRRLWEITKLSFWLKSFNSERMLSSEITNLNRELDWFLILVACIKTRANGKDPLNSFPRDLTMNMSFQRLKVAESVTKCLSLLSPMERETALDNSLLIIPSRPWSSTWSLTLTSNLSTKSSEVIRKDALKPSFSELSLTISNSKSFEYLELNHSELVECIKSW